MAERNTRAFPRVPVHLEVVFHGPAELQAATISSLSQGGVFIRTSRPLPIGTELTLEIRLENQLDKPVTLRGRVVWERSRSDQDGMGVAFLDPLPEAIRKILTQVGA